MRNALTLLRVSLEDPYDPLAVPTKAYDLGLNVLGEGALRETIYQAINLTALLSQMTAGAEGAGRTPVAILNEVAAESTVGDACTLTEVRLSADLMATAMKARDLGLLASDESLRTGLYQAVTLATGLVQAAAKAEGLGRSPIEILNEVSAQFEMQNAISPFGFPDASDGRHEPD